MISPAAVRVLATLVTIGLAFLYATPWEVAVVTVSLIIYNVLQFIGENFLQSEKKAKRW